MAEMGNDQALAATFAFGTIAIAAVAAASLYLRGGTSSLFRDALRLVLVGYLATSFLWALTGFIATFVKMSAVSGCQTAVAFASVFDQLARILLEEFLFWSMNGEIKASIGVLLPQGIFLLRFILAGIFVGVRRPQFKPVCVGTTQAVAVAIVLLVAEAAIVVMLLIRAYSAGLFRDMRDKTAAWPRSRSLLFITLALAVWTALSVPMILGIESFDLVVRTVLPTIGSLIAIALVAIFRSNIKSSLQTTPQQPQGPQMTEAPTRDFSSSSGGLATSNSQSRDASSLYSSDPFEASRRDVPSSSSDSDRSLASREGAAALPMISRPSPGQADAGVGGVPVMGQLFPPIKAQATPAPAAKDLNERPTKKVVLNGSKVTISHPVLNDDDEPERLRRIPTVDLATAARLQKERRDMTPAQPPSSALHGSGLSSSPMEMLNQSQDFKRKEIGMSADSRIDGARQSLQLTEEPLTTGETSSAHTSPTAENMRRRSTTGQAPQGTAPSSPSDPTQKSDVAPDVGPSDASTPSAEPHLSQKPEVQPPMAEDEPERPKLSIMSSNRWSRPGAPTSTTPNPPQMPGNLSASTESMEEALLLSVPPTGPRESLEPSKNSTVVHDSSRQTLASLSRNGPVRADIRPSRQKPMPPPVDDTPEVSKTPVQLRQTSGIPSKPKARMVKPAPRDQAASKEAIRFETVPEKENSGAPLGIMDQALKNIAEQPLRVRAQDRDSIVNRPRPVPRKSAMGHTSPSRGTARPFQSISSRISETPEVGVLSASKITAELLPPKVSGDTNLGPSAQVSSPGAPKEERGLKQPSPPVFDAPTAALPLLPTREDEHAESSSRKETSATTRTPEVPSSDPRPRHSTGKFVSKFSLETSFTAFDGQQTRPSETSLVTIQPPQEDNGDDKRKSSPVIPADDKHSVLASQDWEADQGSRRIHSPEPVAESQVAKIAPSESRTWLEPSDRRQMVQSALLTDDEDEGKETMTVMLDLPAEPRAKLEKQELAGSVPIRGSFHRRVGDKCPTFSDRKRMTRTRLVPRPPPLPLHTPNKTRKDVAAELPPLETPKQALEKIQEQLNKLGELVEPPALDEGQQQAGPAQAQENLQRGMSLLADLEMEMDVQEGHWQEMRRDYSRASVSTIASSDAERASAKLEHMLLAAAGVDSAGLDDSTLNLGGLNDELSSPSDLEKWALGGDENPVSDRALKPDPERAVTSTSLATLPLGDRPHITSSMTDLSGSSTNAATPSLETTPSPSRQDLPRPVSRKGLEPSGDGSPMPRSTSSTPKETRPAERPRTMRPPRRSKRMSSLPDILEDPVPMGGQRGNLGLFQFPWGERSNSASVPLSNQMQAAMRLSMGMGIPVNMGPGAPPVFPTLDAQVRTLHSQEYPSSFFDDYDDDEAAAEDDGPSSDDDEYGEGDDEDPDDDDPDDDSSSDDDDDSFDEATLWEIANLLKSDKVPSRSSLFPEERGARQESSSSASQYQADVESTESRDSGPLTQSSRVPPAGESSSSTQSTQASVWGGKTSHATRMVSMGLPQPEKTWETYVTRPPGTVRAPLRVAQPATLTTSTLWPPASEEPVSSPPGPAVGLWQSTVMLSSSRFAGPIDATDLKETETVTESLPFFLDVTPRCSQPKLAEPVHDDLAPPEQSVVELDYAPEGANIRVTPGEASVDPVEIELLQAPVPSVAVSVEEPDGGESCVLWMPPVATKAEEPRGLFQVHQVCDKKGGMATEPAALKMRPVPRTRPQSLERLESMGLWLPPLKHSFAPDWILLSSIRPSTPEATSSSWSNRSPVTDASSTHSSITGPSTASGSLFAGCLDDAASPSWSQSVHGDGEAASPEQTRQSRPAQPEWEAALAEALAAGGSSSAVQLSAPSEEVAAEGEPLSPNGGFDSSSVHPVFLTSNFDTSVGEVHPAAVGY